MSTVTAKGTPDAPAITVGPADSGARRRRSRRPPTAACRSPTTSTRSTAATPGRPARRPRPSSPLNDHGSDQRHRVRRPRPRRQRGRQRRQRRTSSRPRRAPFRARRRSSATRSSASSGELDVVFTAPASDGGSAITTYQYSTDGGATWRDRQSGHAPAARCVITTESSDGITPLDRWPGVPGRDPRRQRCRRRHRLGCRRRHHDDRPGSPRRSTPSPSATGRRPSRFTPPANGGSAIIALRVPPRQRHVDRHRFTVRHVRDHRPHQRLRPTASSCGPSTASATASLRHRSTSHVFTTPAAPTLDYDHARRRSAVGLVHARTPTAAARSPATSTRPTAASPGATRSTGTTGSPLVITTESGVR